MIEHLSNRDGMMKDNYLALRVLEALQDIAHDKRLPSIAPSVMRTYTIRCLVSLKLNPPKARQN